MTEPTDAQIAVRRIRERYLTDARLHAEVNSAFLEWARSEDAPLQPAEKRGAFIEGYLAALQAAEAAREEPRAKEVE